MQGDITTEFRKSLNNFVGQPCWGIVAGKGTGSVISLHFGNKIPSPLPINNPHLSNDLQKYEGEMILFIQCVWRIDSEVEVICGCWEDNTKDGSMLKGLQNIVEQKVESIELSLPAWDLAIHFSNLITLKIFCDQTDLSNTADNYNLFLPKIIYTVSPKGKLEQEIRKPW